jgi:hypothetical protein
LQASARESLLAAACPRSSLRIANSAVNSLAKNESSQAETREAMGMRHIVLCSWVLLGVFENDARQSIQKRLIVVGASMHLCSAVTTHALPWIGRANTLSQ